MIEHVYRRTADARGLDTVMVATDDERVAAAVQRFGGVVRMTDAAHRTGTDRIAEIARSLTCDIIVNVQGDLPLVDPGTIEQLIRPLRDDRTAVMSTVYRRIGDAAEHANPNVVKVVVDASGRALYFSRAPIPYVRAEEGPAAAGHSEQALSPTVRDVSRTAAGPFRHIGLYAYRRAFLLELASLPQTPLERAESLEQLRALEHGYAIQAVETQYESIEVDTPEDLARVRRLLAAPARA
jgi:3-deoxy-manno-octulosonate cytidylyltransferase (CMP-KDO synthetase)